MERAEHGSLDLLIGKINHEKGTNIALGIIDGLEYVHSQHVIHRDIKPKNILMCGPKDDMIPKIADFGVSKVIETAMMTHTSVGDYLYMAPEVKLNRKYGFTADIFSLAMTLFEMFSEQITSDVSDDVMDFILGIHGGRISEIPESYKCRYISVVSSSVVGTAIQKEDLHFPSIAQHCVVKYLHFVYLCHTPYSYGNSHWTCDYCLAAETLYQLEGGN